MKKARGFTLIELVVVIAIIAVLAAIALPSYVNQIRKARRSEVKAAIQQIALFQERFRADCTTYSTGFGVACPTGTPPTFPANQYTSTYYNVTIVSADGTSYQIKAAANGDQKKDTAIGTSCDPLLYDFGLTKSGQVTSTPTVCWAN